MELLSQIDSHKYIHFIGISEPIGNQLRLLVKEAHIENGSNTITSEETVNAQYDLITSDIN